MWLYLFQNKLKIKIILSTILLVLLTTGAFSQVDNSKQTTQSEYNYMKNSLPDIIQKGLDIKPGYAIVDLDVNDLFEGDNISVKALYRIKNQDSVIVGAIVHIDKVVPDLFNQKVIPWNICVPTTNGYGMQDFKQTLAKETSLKLLQSFSYVMSSLVSTYLITND
jgi:hypothetical protein